MNLKLDGVERSNAVQELTKTFQEIMVSSVATFINKSILKFENLVGILFVCRIMYFLCYSNYNSE